MNEIILSVSVFALVASSAMLWLATQPPRSELDAKVAAGSFLVMCVSASLMAAALVWRAAA